MKGPYNMKKTILITMPVQERHKSSIEKLVPQWDIHYAKSIEIKEELLERAEIIFGNPPPEKLYLAKKLEWIQLVSAGADAYTPKGVLLENTLLTNATGGYGLAVSEHMLSMLLGLYKNLPLYRDNQSKQLWQVEGKVKSIYRSKVLVLGLGDIGNEFAKKIHALGGEVTGIKRDLQFKPDYVEKLYTLDHLEELLPQMDVVAMILPSTEETYHIINDKTLSLMKPSAVLINAGRGSAVDSDALYRALIENRLFGAGLDVTEAEPLPAEHPLWTCKNLMITPHSAGGFLLEETFERIWDIALLNLEAFIAGNVQKNIIKH